MKKTITTTDILALWWKSHRGELTEEETIAELANAIKRHSPDFPHDDPTTTRTSVRAIMDLAEAIEAGEEPWRLWGALLVVWPFGYPPDTKLTPIHEMFEEMRASDEHHHVDLFSERIRPLPVPDHSTSKRGQHNG